MLWCNKLWWLKFSTCDETSWNRRIPEKMVLVICGQTKLSRNLDWNKRICCHTTKKNVSTQDFCKAFRFMIYDCPFGNYVCTLSECSEFVKVISFDSFAWFSVWFDVERQFMIQVSWPWVHQSQCCCSYTVIVSTATKTFAKI